MFNHNLETVPSKYLKVRPGARYFHSIRLLQRVKELDPTIFTKSGIMVGLGEERNEVLQLMDDLRSAEVDFLTIGQYLQPTRKHHPVIRFVTPDEFKAYETTAYAKGFLLVSATPLTRSSHHAGEDFAKLKAARLAQTLIEVGDAVLSQHTAGRGIRPTQMFDLVADVERYPEFLPLCEWPARRPPLAERRGGRDARRRDERRLQGHPRELHEPRHPRSAARCTILVEYVDGPFKYLENRWTFRPRRGRLRGRVSIINYEFKSFALGLLMGSMFDSAFRRFAEAFEERANEIYGRPAPAASAGRLNDQRASSSSRRASPTALLLTAPRPRSP